MSDKEFQNLYEYLELARGLLTYNKFANVCGITPGYLSRIIHQKSGEPSPDVLKKIAEHSQDSSVTYEKLMECLNYITAPSILDDYRKKIDEDYLEINSWINSGECERYINFAFRLWKSGFPIDLLESFELKRTESVR